MTELVETGYKYLQGDTTSIGEVMDIITNNFTSDDFYLLETPREYISGKISELSESNMKNLLSITVFSECKELCAEKNSNQFSYRIIEDDESSEKKAYTREIGYLLRKSPVNSGLFTAGFTKIRNKEYFEFNEDGMPLIKFSRLCGYEKGE
ncbi:MAG: hypothetical protein ACI4NE_07490 [Succinivibrio sp.]